MSTLEGKSVIITGGGRGLGRALVRRFIAEGARVASITHTKKSLKELTRSTPQGARTYFKCGDASSEKTVMKFVKTTLKKFSNIDVLINNAGILTPKSSLPSVSTEDWDKTIQTNLKAPFLFMKHVLPIMMAQSSGLILNVTSGAGQRAAPGWGPYAVSKAGLQSLTLLTAAEFKNTGIRINSVNPGGTRTAMRAMAYPSENPLSLPSPDEVAKLFVWLCTDEAQQFNGQWVEYREWKDQI